MISNKPQRLRDPIHGLIHFDQDDVDQRTWSLIQTPEFQRLRRIRQLGFSELVFPGATHTRFAHSLGVFQTARRLIDVLRARLGKSFDAELASLAATAALLHDVGHGPFSHAFENALKAVGLGKSHEQWTAEILTGETAIQRCLSAHEPAWPQRLAAFFVEDGTKSIYSAIVSSQFDADRLDYLRRDKAMTGTEHGGFDWAWLLDCLDVDRITLSLDDEDYDETDTLVVSHKGLQAAEAYLLGRFHLYQQVYLHKTTRAAEKMLTALLTRIARLCKDGAASRANLPLSSPLLQFLQRPGLEQYLALDDTVVWGSLGWLAQSEDDALSELAIRLRDRRLYKCFDVGARVETAGKAELARFKKRLNDALTGGELRRDLDVLTDEARCSAYTMYDYESRGALQKILVRRADGSGDYADVVELSPIVAGIGERRFYRVYARNDDTMTQIQQLWKEARHG